MAQVQFVSAGGGGSLATIGSFNIPYPTGILSGDILVIHACCRNNLSAISQPSATGFVSARNYLTSYSGSSFLESTSVLSKISNGTETGVLAISFTNDSTSTLKIARMYAFRNQILSGVYQTYFLPVSSLNLDGTTPPPPVSLQNELTGITNIVAFGDIWSPQNDALGLCFVNVWDDNPLTAPTGTTGGTWIETTPEFTSTAGTDCALGLFSIPLTANQYVNGGTFSMGGGAADPWASRCMLLLAQSPGVSYVQTDSFNQRGFFGL